jgi:hypothetical protein
MFNGKYISFVEVKVRKIIAVEAVEALRVARG